MEYYTYAYLREDKTPYYIGKGKCNRINDPHKHIPVPPKERRILLKQNLTEEEAYRHEEYLISVFGRKIDGGILINLMSGGGAPTHGILTRQLLRAKRSNQIFTPEVHKKRALSNTGKKRTQEQCRNISEGFRHAPISFIHEDGRVVDTTLVAEFCRDYSLHHSLISKVMRGKRLSHKGWRVN